MTKCKSVAAKCEPLVELVSDVKYIRTVLEGNGDEGLIKQVRSNNEYIIAAKERKKLIEWAVGGGWALSIIIGVLGWLSRV